LTGCIPGLSHQQMMIVVAALPNAVNSMFLQFRDNVKYQLNCFTACCVSRICFLCL